MSVIHAIEPKNINDATQCLLKILDAEYKKADLTILVSKCTHILALTLLTKYETLFDSAPGWYFDLKEESAPHNGKCYLIHGLHHVTFKKGINRLEYAGV